MRRFAGDAPPRPPLFGKPVVLRPRPSTKKIRRDAWTCDLGTKITCPREHPWGVVRPGKEEDAAHQQWETLRDAADNARSRVERKLRQARRP
jgi:hypothetical protein